MELPQGEASQTTMEQMSRYFGACTRGQGALPSRLFARRVVAAQGCVVFFGFKESVRLVSNGCNAVGFTDVIVRGRGVGLAGAASLSGAFPSPSRFPLCLCLTLFLVPYHSSRE